MEHEAFWQLVDAARNAPGETARVLEETVAGLSPSEIRAFDGWLAAYLHATRREDLWAAVYLIRGGCSDDSFDYFRGWLVARGHAALRAAIEDPETLGELNDGAMRDERMLSVGRRAYAAHGALPSSPAPSIPGLSDWPADRIAPRVKWTNAFLRERYPRLWARYGASRPEAPSGAIPRERFWAIVEQARAARREPTVRAHFAALLDHLTTAPLEEALGFCRWIGGYNEALIRNDLRAACRVLLGSVEVEAFAGFRGWLILQGEAALNAAVRDPDAITVSEPPRCLDVVHVATVLGDRRKTYLVVSLDEGARPDTTGWPEDRGEVAGGQYTPELLRAQLPRLTRDATDASLTGRSVGAKPASVVRAAPKPAAPIAAPPTRARHPKFGDGAIVSIEGTGESAKLVIDFASGRKTLMRRFVEVLE